MENNSEHCVKYNRTFHTLWSKGIGSDDKYATDLSIIEDEEVYISEKMDGECTTMYPYYGKYGIHARSIDSKKYWYHEWCRALQISLVEKIHGYRLCGENLNAIHSIEYKNLVSYFYLFSIWNQETNICLSLDEMLEFNKDLGLAMPKILYRGKWDAALFEKMFNEMDTETMEGYVIRVTRSFHYDDFSKCVVKAVRENHVQTDEHWRKNAKEAKLSDPKNVLPISMRG